MIKILCILNPKLHNTRPLKWIVYFPKHGIADQNNNVITDGPQVTVVLHICDRKI